MSTHLIQLINSLTRSEKRFIHLSLKTFSSSEESSILLQDFNMLEHHLGLKRTKRLPEIKSNSTRLYYRILDLLFECNKEQLYENETHNQLIKRSQVLFQKGFYQEGLKHLDKVIYKGFSYSYLLQIEAIELRIKAAIKFVDVEYLQHSFEKEKMLLSEISRYYFNQLEFESIWAIVKLESSTSHFYGAKNVLLDKYASLLADESFALGAGSKIYFHQINAFLAMKSNNLTTAMKHLDEVTDLFEWHPELKENRFSDYLRNLRNKSIIHIRTKTYAEVNDFLTTSSNEILLNRKSKSVAYKNDVFTLTILLRLDNIVSNEKIFENLTLLDEFDTTLKENEKYIALDEKTTAYFLMATSFFISGNYRKALRRVNQAIALSKTVRKDLHHLSLMLELCIHFSLENTDLFETKLNSFRKFVTKTGYLFSFEEELYEFLKKIIQSPNIKKYMIELNDFIELELDRTSKMEYKCLIPFRYLKPY